MTGGPTCRSGDAVLVTAWGPTHDQYGLVALRDEPDPYDDEAATR